MGRNTNRDTLYITPVISNDNDPREFLMPIIDNKPGMKKWIYDNKDLYKTKVYDLSNFRNSHSEVIPENIILKEPSAELRPNQIDKDSLPDYEELDTILNLYIENDSSSESIIATGIEASLVYDVLEKVDRNEYKRKQVAPGVKLTEKAFGKDRRMPITNTYIRQRD